MSDPIARPGKTKRDRENGAYARNQSNKASRVAWQQGPDTARFPLHTCNGKRSRSLKK